MSRAYDDIMSFDPEVINVGDRMRDLNEVSIGPLMESIKKIGQQVPIAVIRLGGTSEKHYNDGKLFLVAGLHRLEACKRLEEPVIVRMFKDEREAKLWEISENFHRAELDDDQRAEHFAAWEKMIAEDVQLSQPGTVEKKSGRGHNPKRDDSIRSRAERANLPKTEVHRFDKINSVKPEARKELRAAGLASNQAAILRIADAPPEKQVEKVREIAAAKSAPVVATVAKVASSVLSELVALWRKASSDDKAAFRAHIG